MDVNKARFYKIIYDTTIVPHERYNIGTYKEKQLHLILKKYFDDDISHCEIPLEGFVADIFADGVVTEIETNGFSGLKQKLEAFLPKYHVRLVYPLSAKKYVSWIDTDTNDFSKRSLSPKKEGVYDVLFELVKILPYVRNCNLTILAPLLEIDEYRLKNGWSRDRKRGSHRFERIPCDIFGIIELSTNDDYLSCIPDSCEDEFTASDFMKTAHIKSAKVYAILKVLSERGVIEKTHKKGRSYIYKRVTQNNT